VATFDPILAGFAAASAVGWTTLAAARATSMRKELLLRGLLGGTAAFALAFSGYALLDGSGIRVTWEGMLAGGWPAVGLALLIGLLEEGAKLAGILLAARDLARPGVALILTVGVSAGFAGLEAVSALSEAPTLAALGRALLAPVAHAALALPLGLAIAWSARRRLPAALAVVGPALLVAALLHGASDLSLTSTWPGRLGFAVALLAPVLALFAYARAVGRTPARAAVTVRGP
jgi:RsiW-degrading membrane proteinase PrsW (M82 family)